MKRIVPGTFILSMLFLLPSCEKTPDDYKLESGLEYFPLQVGKLVEFEVDSIIYTPTGSEKNKTSKTFFREVVSDSFPGINGNIVYKIERYQRKEAIQPWQIQKVLTAELTNERAYRTEDNLRFIKLVFPVRKNKTWDGNVHFNPGLIVNVEGESLEMFKNWQSKITDLMGSETIGTLKLIDVVNVQIANSENLIELRRGTEKYAKGIGLIYRELWILDTQCIEKCTGKPWTEKAEKGFIVKQKITAWN